MPRLKILVITNWYPTKEEPSKAVWVREQTKAAGLFDDVLVLHCVEANRSQQSSWTIEPEADEEIRDGVATYRLRYRRFAVPLSSYFAYLLGVFRAFRYIVNLGFRPDIIHVHVYDAGAPAILIGKLHRIPVVISEHFSSFQRGSLRTIDRLKARTAFRWANAVFPVSQALKSAIEGYGMKARFQVIANEAV